MIDGGQRDGVDALGRARTEVGPRPTVAVPAMPVGYRPHLDGLRAVAVYLVVAFHAGIEQLRGGFIGVDVFFVLSGYLVTQVLVRDLDAHGSVRFGRFYARRARRLLPAAAATLLVTAVVFSVVGSPAAVDDAREAIRASALYVANWFFVSRSDDYFGADVAANPVLHFWSLAVEEQFYVVWPLVLSALVVVARRAGRHTWTVVRAAVAVAGLASVAAALHLARTDLDRAYYGTDARAYQLLAGALVALTPGLVGAARRLPGSARGLPVVATAGLGAVAALSLSRVGVGPITRGLATTVVVAVVLVTLEAGRHGWAARALSAPPLAYLGRISYGTYLWHWPVIVVVEEVVDLSSRPLTFVTVLVASGLASLSHELLEQPIRRWGALDRRPRPVVAVGLAISLLVGVVAVPRLLHEDGDASGTAVAASGATVGDPGAVAVDWRAARDDLIRHWECADPVAASCPVVDGAGLHVLVMGDSHANALIPMLERVAEERDLRLSAAVVPVCPWQQDLQYAAGERGERCAAAKGAWYRSAIAELDPDVVMVGNRPIDGPTNRLFLIDAEDGVVAARSPEQAAAVERATREVVDRLVGEGRRVVFLEPIPVTEEADDPLACLAGAEEVAECRFVAPTSPSAIERAYRAMAEDDPAVWSVDMDQLVCPYLPICDPVVGGRIVRRDPIHLTASYARSLADAFTEHLDEQGILDR